MSQNIPIPQRRVPGSLKCVTRAARRSDTCKPALSAVCSLLQPCDSTGFLRDNSEYEQHRLDFGQ